MWIFENNLPFTVELSVLLNAFTGRVLLQLKIDLDSVDGESEQFRKGRGCGGHKEVLGNLGLLGL